MPALALEHVLGPVTVLLTGETKIGKTGQMLGSFGCAPDPLIIAANRARVLHVARKLYGPVWPTETGYPCVWEGARYLEDHVARLGPMAESGELQRYGSVIIIDFTHQCRASVNRWSQINPNPLDGFYEYKLLKPWIERVCDICTYAHRDLGVETHLAEPHRDEKKGIFQVGGPDVASRNRVRDVLSRFELAGRGDRAKGRAADEHPDPYWPVRLHTDENDSNYVQADTLVEAASPYPFNLREILRAAEHQIPRLPGYEWLDEWADAVAENFTAEGVATPGAGVRSRDWAMAHWKKTMGEPDIQQRKLIRWFVQDGIARATLQYKMATYLSGDSAESSSAPLPPPVPQ